MNAYLFGAYCSFHFFKGCFILLEFISIEFFPGAGVSFFFICSVPDLATARFDRTRKEKENEEKVISSIRGKSTLITSLHQISNARCIKYENKLQNGRALYLT